MGTKTPPVLDPADVAPGLPPKFEAVFLRVVMRWATLDGAISQAYVAAHGLNDLESADEVSDQPASWKLRQLQLAFRPHAPRFAEAFGKLKKQYDRYSRTRNTIAHCHCAGHLKSSPDYAVFQLYRGLGSGLIVDAIPIDRFYQAARFGEHLTKVVQDIDNRIRAAMPQQQQVREL